MQTVNIAIYRQADVRATHWRNIVFAHSNSCSSGVYINVLLLCDLIVIDVSLAEHLNIGQIASNWRSAFHPAMIIIEPSVQSSMLVRC